MLILLQLLSLLKFFICLAVGFSPDTNNYDAYGLKIAANNFMIVAAQNDLTRFLIQFAPYTDNITQSNERGCFVDYTDSSQFVYTVALGKNQSEYNIFFVGEMINLNESDKVVNRTFVGVISYTGSNTIIDCDNGFTIATQYVESAFPHQEHLVMVSDPLSLVAYGFSNLFTFSYTAAGNNLIVYPNNSLSPSISFLPFAVDYDGNRGIITGFLDNGRNARM